MKRLLLFLAILCLPVFAACSQQEYTDMSSLQPTPAQGTPSANIYEDGETDTIEPSESPTPANLAGGTVEGTLTDAQVEELMARVDQVSLDDTDIPYLNQIVTDLQPIMDAFQNLTGALSTTDFENAEWVAQVTEYATTLETACDTAIEADYGENLDDLEQLLNAGYDAFKKGATSLKEAVNDKDVDKLTDSTSWLMLGINYETKASEYLQILSAASTSPDTTGSPAASGTAEP